MVPARDPPPVQRLLSIVGEDEGFFLGDLAILVGIGSADRLIEHLVRPVHGGDLVRENDRDVELGLALRRARRRADLLHGLIEGPGRGIGLEGDGQALLVPMDSFLMGDQGTAAQTAEAQEHSGRNGEKCSERHHSA